MNTHRAGIDIGTTTVKLVVLNENNDILSHSLKKKHPGAPSAFPEC